jgi:hypothetical protein
MILNVKIVHRVQKWHNIIFAVLCINSVMDCHKTATERGEYIFQVGPGFKVISTKPAKVFDEDKINLTFPHILNHFLKSRPLERTPGESIIYIEFDLNPTVHHCYKP